MSKRKQIRELKGDLERVQRELDWSRKDNASSRQANTALETNNAVLKALATEVLANRDGEALFVTDEAIAYAQYPTEFGAPGIIIAEDHRHVDDATQTGRTITFSEGRRA